MTSQVQKAKSFRAGIIPRVSGPSRRPMNSWLTLANWPLTAPEQVDLSWLRVGATGESYHGPGENRAAGVSFTFSDERFHLLKFARYLCAGSVVKRALARHYWVEGEEDASDYEKFLKGYVSQLSDEQVSELSKGQGRDKLAEVYWRRAQQDVERDLREPAFRREMLALADEVEKKIPWGIKQ